MINIRKIHPEDREKIYEMLQQTNMFTPAEIDVAMELVDVFLFNKEQRDYLIYVAEYESSGVAGYICYGPAPGTDGTFDLYWIVVSPAFQNRGIGRQLLYFAEDEIRQKNGRLIVIETSSQPKYLPTRQFYEKNEYRLAGEIKDFYRPGDNRIIFVKYLNS